VATDSKHQSIKAGRARAILVAATIALPKWKTRLYMEVRSRASIQSWRIKNRSKFHFKGDTIVALLLVQMKHTHTHK